ncbi:MAG: dihydropteroate synthase [Dehalococcoidia bacterium]
MGIINVTPDSFSGDGIQGNPSRAAALAARFEAEGAAILDIGAESSRPGAAELSPAEELRRLLPALESVRATTALPISVDTYHPAVAEVALAHGADAVNDISGLRRDAAMASLVARTGCALIAMHNQRGQPFHDVAGDITAGFTATLAEADRAGIDPSRVILDPGFGFGWTPEQNLEMVRRLPEFWPFRLPLLLGPSRKSTIGHLLDAPVEDRLDGTAALTALGIAGGADIIRVHDVAAMSRVLRVSDAVVRANWRFEVPGAASG